MEVLIHTFIQTKATWGKRTCPRFATASVGLHPGPLDLETCALPTRPPRPTIVMSLRQTHFSSSHVCHRLQLMLSRYQLTHSISLLRSPYSSSARWNHLQSLSSDVFLVSSLHISKPPQSRFPATSMWAKGLSLFQLSSANPAKMIIRYLYIQC